MRRYSRIPTTTNLKGNRMYKTVRYPEIPRTTSDVYIYTTIGDRFDTLAQQYYQDSSLWWLISAANPQLTQMSMYPPLGIQIRIPMNVGNAISLYNRINESY